MIRPMIETDISVIIEALYELANSSPTYRHMYHTNEDYVHDRITCAIDSPSFIGLIDDNYRGFMLSGLASMWFSPQIDCHEQLLYVFPEHRGGRLAPSLILATEKIAKEAGAINILAGVSTGIDDARVEELYIKLGYTRNGHTLTKRLN